MNGQSLKKMGRWLGMVCAGSAWAAGDSVSVKEFISDTSSYVVLTASDPNAQAASFAASGNWSDGAAPSGEWRSDARRAGCGSRTRRAADHYTKNRF